LEGYWSAIDDRVVKIWMKIKRVGFLIKFRIRDLWERERIKILNLPVSRIYFKFRDLSVGNGESFTLWNGEFRIRDLSVEFKLRRRICQYKWESLNKDIHKIIEFKLRRRKAWRILRRRGTIYSLFHKVKLSLFLPPHYITMHHLPHLILHDHMLSYVPYHLTLFHGIIFCLFCKNTMIFVFLPYVNTL